LSKQEKMSSNFVAVALVVLLAGVALFINSSMDKYLVVAAYGFAMMVFCSKMFLPSKYHSIMLYTIAMAILGLATIWMAFTNNPVTITLINAFVIGFLAFQFAVNFMVIRRSNR